MNKILMFLFSAAILLSAAVMTAQEEPRKGNAPAEDMPPGPPPPPPRMKSPHDYFMEKLTPAERDEIAKLVREKKVAELKAKMRQLFMKYRPEEDKRVSALSEKYLAAGTDEEKNQIRKELEAAIRAQFAKRMEFTQRNISDAEAQLKTAEKRLKMLKEHYERNQKKSEEIIQMRLKWMCTPKAERRKLRPPRDKRKGPPPQEHFDRQK